MERHQTSKGCQTIMNQRTREASAFFFQCDIWGLGACALFQVGNDYPRLHSPFLQLALTEAEHGETLECKRL
jgi:hypothetical protein